MHSWSTFGARMSHGQLKLTRLTTARTWGSHHLPPYSIFYASPRGPHPNGFLSWDSQVAIPKLPRLGLPQLWSAITMRADLQWRWCLKQSCSPCWELSNTMLHATCTQGNRVDSWLLVVGSQIVDLIPVLFFGHNLCFICPNGWCEHILDIYILKAFQWYKERFKPLRFDPCNVLWRFGNPLGFQLPKWKPLGVWGFIPSHPLTLPRICCVTLGFLLGPQPCKPLPWSQAQG